MRWIVAVLLLYFFQFAVVVFIEYRRPYKAITWLVILHFLPLVGLLAYYFVAKEYCAGPTNRNENKKLEQIKEHLIDLSARRFPKEQFDQTVWQDNRMHSMLRNASSFPISSGNETTVYAEGEEAFEAMLESIASAKHHIHIEFFIIRDDRLGTKFQQLLIQKARAGVRVRILYDGMGSLGLGKKYVKRLQAAGVETGCFFPLFATFINKRVNYRNHRKIVVVDGKIGFIGGLNIGDEYLGEDPKVGYWRDTFFSIKGDAVLWIQYTFLNDWNTVNGQALTDPAYYPVQENEGTEFVQIVKSGPDETILELIFSIIVSAKKRICIETPYFIPEPGVLLALKTAAMSGVDVRIIIPCVPDSKLVYYASLSYVQELLELGVRFYCYEKGFLHAKVLIADNVACSGTANMDMRSFCGQFEINAVFFDGNVVDRLVHDFYRDAGDSHEIVPAEFKKRPKLQKSKEAFARLLSPLF